MAHEVEYYVPDSRFLDDLCALTGRERKDEVVRDALEVFSILLPLLDAGERMLVGPSKPDAVLWPRHKLVSARATPGWTEGGIVLPFNYISGDSRGIVAAMKRRLDRYDTAHVLGPALGVHQELAVKLVAQDMRVYMDRPHCPLYEPPLNIYENARTLIGRQRQPKRAAC